MVLDLIYVSPYSSDDTKSVLVESQKEDMQILKSLMNVLNYIKNGKKLEEI